MSYLTFIVENEKRSAVSVQIQSLEEDSLTSFTIGPLFSIANLPLVFQSGWQLLRPVKTSPKKQAIDEEACRLFKTICRDYDSATICLSDYLYWKEKVMKATERKQCTYYNLNPLQIATNID